jgi:3-hydroxyisobutyrate dehydrogenase-like beta-hydroxyacid dehydrogenase
MAQGITLIGYGEAGRSFACAARWGADARVYDLRPLDALYADDGVRGCANMADAAADTDVIISLVTADQADVAAEHAAQYIAPGALFLDMNSVAPATKLHAAQVIDAAGGRYVDAAIMSPVNPLQMAVPILLCGPHADAGARALGNLGFTKLRVVGGDIGRASTIKMLRSVMYKGVEALTAECLIACERAGVTDEVLGSFGGGAGGGDWASGADYRLDRMLVHGLRRSAEMHESTKTLRALGVPPMLTKGTADWQQAVGALAISPVPDGLSAKLKAILEKMP